MHVCIKQWYQISGTKLDVFLQSVHDVCFSSLLQLLSRMVWVKEAHCEETPEITNSMVAISSKFQGPSCIYHKLTEKKRC